MPLSWNEIKSRALNFSYETVVSDPHMITAKTVNVYLVDGPEIIVLSRRSPLCPVPEIKYGSICIDDGHLILTEEKK